MKKNIHAHLGIAIITIVVLALSLFMPKTMFQQSEFQNVSLGYPIPFIQQSLSYDFQTPYHYRFLSPWEHPTKILPLNLLASFVIVFVSLKLLLVGFGYIIKEFRSRK